MSIPFPSEIMVQGIGPAGFVATGGAVELLLLAVVRGGVSCKEESSACSSSTLFDDNSPAVSSGPSASLLERGDTIPLSGGSRTNKRPIIIEA